MGLGRAEHRFLPLFWGFGDRRRAGPQRNCLNYRLVHAASLMNCALTAMAREEPKRAGSWVVEAVRGVGRAVLSDNRSTLCGCGSGRSVEVCGSERRISSSRLSRRSVATRRCARTSLTGSRPARSRPGSATHRPACIRWPASCALAAARSTSVPPSPGPGRHARPTVSVTACSSYALWTALWRRSPPSWSQPARRCPRRRSGQSCTPRASSACHAAWGPTAARRHALQRSRPKRSPTGRPPRRSAAITPACSCSSPRSHSSGSQNSSRPVATRQRRSSQHGTRSGRCCYTNARGPRAPATRTRSLMTPAWRC